MDVVEMETHTLSEIQKMWPFPKHNASIGLVRRGSGGEALPLLDAYRAVGEVSSTPGFRVGIVSARTVEAIFSDPKSDLRIFRECQCFPTDTLIAYPAAGKAFGDEVVWKGNGKERIVLPAGAFRGASGVALVVQDAMLIDFRRAGNEFIIDVPHDRLLAVEDFPQKCGWYLPDIQTTVPCGSELKDCSGGARYLWRSENETVAPLVRETGMNSERLASVGASFAYNAKFGVLVEMWPGDGHVPSGPSLP